MVAVKTALVLAICSISILLSSTQVTYPCEFVYSNWTTCTEGRQNRSAACICDKTTNHFSTCLKKEISVLPLSRECNGDDERSMFDCKWKWTKWSGCSRECGGGNTTRKQVCVCRGYGAAPEDYCIDTPHYGVEICPCNDFPCGDTPAFNKMYWMHKDEEGFWPMVDGTFNCTLGVDPNVSDHENPRGKKYSEVLRDPEPESYKHYEWYYLAKEWIACRLNIANGAKMTPEAMQVIEEMGKLLEYCNGWPEHDKYDIYAGKEKLGRINNNIGGLSNVDDEMALLTGGGKSGNDEREGSGPNASLTLVLVVAIPVLAIFILGIVIGLTVYHVREKKAAVQDQAAFESEDEPSEGEPLQSNVQDPSLPQEVELESEKPVGDETSDGEDHH